MVRFWHSNNCNIGSRTERVSVLKKIGYYFGKLKNTLSSFQREVSSVTEKIDIDKDISNTTNVKKEKDVKENE